MSTQIPSSPAPDAEATSDEPTYQKPRAGVYTMLLLVSFSALMVGSFCLYKEMERYDFQHDPKAAKYSTMQDNPDVNN